jgi:hypothetical protein
MQEGIGHRGSTSSPRFGSGGNKAAEKSVITYFAGDLSSVTHLHANFGKLNKKQPPFIHGAALFGTSGLSDPRTGKPDKWGSRDPTRFVQFEDVERGTAPYGLAPGDVAGAPNVMDVSQSIGFIHGENFPGGMPYFRSIEEERGRFLAPTVNVASPSQGIPKVPTHLESISAVWIAKTPNVATATEGLVGMLSGSSLGILTAYSCGSAGLVDRRLNRGEITARWALCPGVPIVAIQIDDLITTSRLSQHRVWAVVLNALGEVYYLTTLPCRRNGLYAARLEFDELERLAWDTGRSVHWDLIESTRRTATPDPYGTAKRDWSQSPKSTDSDITLSETELKAEANNIDEFLNLKPKDIQRNCSSWDMRRSLQVDFASGDESGHGELVVVVDPGLDGNATSLTRYSRFRLDEFTPSVVSQDLDSIDATVRSSIFGGPSQGHTAKANTALPLHSAKLDQGNVNTSEQWRASKLIFSSTTAEHITTTAIDMSSCALLTVSEDPLCSTSGSSVASSPRATPIQDSQPVSLVDIPGQRGRFIAAGTTGGMIFVWDMRSSLPSNPHLTPELRPIRVIQTDSPQISCLAITALYLVHGGNDGLVQAWDPLASTAVPIRTLNSRFSSRARRRLQQADVTTLGVGDNQFAAGAICLDPDPSVLQGVVSLGTHLRYWRYSSAAADQYSSRKRRLRRSERGSNEGGGDKFGSSRGAIADYIESERVELQREKERKLKADQRLAGRFGIGLLGHGETEAEMLAYARMLSEEAFQKEKEKRRDSDGDHDKKAIEAALAASLARRSSAEDSENQGEPEAAISPTLHPSAWSSETATPDGSVLGASTLDTNITDETQDPELAEAIRLSLLDDSNYGGGIASGPGMPSSSREVPIRYTKAKGRRSPSSSPRTQHNFSNRAGSSTISNAALDDAVLESDLDLALRLSLAEEQSKREAEDAILEEFPSLAASNRGTSPTGSAAGKDKGKRRVS